MKKKIFYILTIIFSMLDSFNMVLFAIFQQKIVDSVIYSDIKLYNSIVFFSLVFLFWLSIAQYLADLFLNYYIFLSIKDLKCNIVKSLIYKEDDEKDNDNYLSIITNDITIYENEYLKSSINICRSIIVGLSSIIILINYSLIIFITTVLFSLMPLLISKLISKKNSDKKMEVSNSKIDELNFIKNILSGLFTIKGYNAQSKFYNRVESKIYKVEETVKSYNNYMCKFSALSAFFSNGVFISLFIIGTLLTLRGDLTIGILIASIQLSNNIVFPLSNTAKEINKITSTRKIRERFKKLLSDNHSTTGKPLGPLCDNIIQFNDVSFKIKDSDFLIKNINIEINKNKKYAIIGESGSGKSTTLKLLLNPKLINDGKYIFSNKNCNEVDLFSFRENVSFVLQNDFIFEGSILENITLLNTHFNFEDIENVLKITGFKEVMEKRNLTLETQISDEKLSGGEKQRLLISRALLRDSNIVVMDEPTSSLDKVSSSFIESNILKMDRTIIMVTHKLDKVVMKQFDELIIFSEGEIIAKGNYDELYDGCDEFRRLISIPNL
ncbi:ABC transporter ATP-binding protein [Anaerorhabdus sp.]|uniref:ABC transporter ATP-binding protein n=1 Tax=Anaerorhabdus sp. TaxID=1872524 RepID=UPI002FCA174F